MAKNTKEYDDAGKRRVPASKFKCNKCCRTFTSAFYLGKHCCVPENKKYYDKK